MAGLGLVVVEFVFGWVGCELDLGGCSCGGRGVVGGWFLRWMRWGVIGWVRASGDVGWARMGGCGVVWSGWVGVGLG